MFFWNITTKLLQQNLIEGIKNTNVHAQLVIPFFWFLMSHLALVAEQPKPDYCIKIVVSELFFLFSSSCAQDSVHHFCPISVSPKKPGTKTRTFSKNDFALQK